MSVFQVSALTPPPSYWLFLSGIFFNVLWCLTCMPLELELQ